MADAKAFLGSELVEQSYKLPFSCLELEGTLLVRKIEYELRTSESKGDTTQITIPKVLIPLVLDIAHCKFCSPH